MWAPRRAFVVNATAFRYLLVDTPFEALFASIDGAFPANHRYAADHVWSNSAPRDLLASLRDTVVSPPSPRDFLMLALSPARPQESPPLPSMALSMLAATYVGVYGVWSDPAHDQDNRAWVRSMNAALEPHKVGSYVGDADVEGGLHRSQECFSAPAWERLAALKRKYDPEDLFFSYSIGR